MKVIVEVDVLGPKMLMAYRFSDMPKDFKKIKGGEDFILEEVHTRTKWMVDHNESD